MPSNSPVSKTTAFAPDGRIDSVIDELRTTLRCIVCGRTENAHRYPFTHPFTTMPNDNPTGRSDTTKKSALKPALCSPSRRLEGFTEDQFVDIIRWHEQEAESAMRSLSCGSENWEYREANRVADAHWCAAALLRQHIKAPE